MKKETIFLSYARVDAAFALKLAEDLKNSGSGVWVDQASIKAGNRWDASIEAALNDASRLIIILSPASVASNNVMDEVSFALENKKEVIPVLLSECTTPFRLRRLQRIDFTKNYQNGISKLLEALSEPTMAKNEDSEEKDKDGENIYFVEKQDKKRFSKKNFFVSVCILLSVVIVWIVASNARNKSVEENAWKGALNRNDSGSYGNYLEDFPSGSHRKESIRKMDSISRSAERSAISVINDSIVKNRITSAPNPDSNKSVIAKKKEVASKLEKTTVIVTKETAPKVEIGKYYQGGIVYFLDSTGTHGLIVAEKELRTQDDDNTVHTDFKYDEAVKICSDLVLNGYTDWYLPSKNELNKLYRALETIPIHFTYSYWSSTEDDNANAWAEMFKIGRMFTFPKYSALRVLPIRAF